MLRPITTSSASASSAPSSVQASAAANPSASGAQATTVAASESARAQTGASSAEQIEENVGALKKLDFSAAELAEIDKHAIDLGINLWEKPSTDQRP